ncbi:hypothetical protein IQ03_04553 [Gemmobacter caeni]|uniref:hypothetical protein n=1 Tax=Gemmobacter caeni TaxID=589035 RepID=UPI0011AA017D|nr:hypothetical protein [Gemmobacter caeni]TWI93792.1 hypothetical protein IQ03_04553 [Gemmobacter caeni]
MIITLSPIRSDAALTLIRQGDTLILNGVAYDFGPLPEGATLPREAIACDWLASDVTRIDGKIRLTLILPHGPIPLYAPPEARVITHPEPITVTTDGPIPLPSYTPEEATQ